MAFDEARSDDTDDASGDPYGGHLWPRPADPLLRSLDPRRIRRRWQTRRAVRYEHYGPQITEGRATDQRSITFYHRDQSGWPVGKLSYLICHQCRIGFIGNIDVQQNLWGRGIATGALAYLRDRLPGYTWQTSRHKTTAKSFWLLVAERTGAGYVDTMPADTCEHLARYWQRGPTFHTETPPAPEPGWVRRRQSPPDTGP